MSNNAFIDLIARLNKKDSKEQIKTNLGEIASELNKLKDNGLNIQCHIDTSSEAVNKLQGELNTLANKLKLNIGVDAKSIASTVASKTQSDNSTTTSTVKIDKMSAQSQISELSKLLQSQLQGEADAVIKSLVGSLKNSLGETTEIWTTWERTADGALKNFSISTKKATGDLEKFNFVVNETGKVDLLGSSGSDKGILQKQKETLKFVDEYTAKINSLRSPSTQNFTASYNNQTVTFESLDKDLENLRKGEGSIEEVRGKFVALQGAISSVRDIIKESQGKSLDPFTNAKIAAKEFDNTLKSINVDLDNLKGFKTNNDGVPTVKELNKEYKDLSKAISMLNQVEESQRGNQWYKDFADASEKVRQLQSDIKLLNKLKREDASSGTKKQAEELLKITHAYRELQKLEKRRFSGEASNDEIKRINSLEGGYRRIINTAQDRLKKQELLTSEVKKTIAEEEKALNIARNFAKDEQLRKEANNKRSQYMNEITQAYSRMNAQYSKLYSPKSSEEEKRLAQERIKWNQDIIDLNKQNLETENLLTQKNDDKLKQLQAINEQKQKEAQAGANRVAQSQAETERLKQEKKEAKELADTITKTITKIEKGYEKLAILYSGKTAPTNGTAKNNIDKAESARKHSELQTQLSELEAIVNANDKITAQQKEQIANAKAQYEEDVIRYDLYNKLIINEQNATQAEKESVKLSKERTNTVNNYITQIEKAYEKMGKINKEINKSNVGGATLLNEQSKYDEQEKLVKEKERELEIYLSSLSVGNKLTEQEKQRINDAKKRLQIELETQNASLIDANIAKQKAEQIKKEKAEYDNILSTIKEYQDILSGFNNANITKQNKGNSAVGNQVSINTDLLGQLETLKQTLGDKNSINTDKLNRVRNAIKGLSDDLNNAKTNSIQLKNSLVDERTSQAVIKDFNNLRNSIKTFASINPKAINSSLEMKSETNGITTFRKEFENLVNRMNDPNIVGDKNAITKLKDDFRNFQGQANSFGLTTNKLLVDMGSQLKMVINRFISLYAVIGYIRKMTDDIKNLDNAMINLRRVTDETETGYTSFLERANKQARDLKITTSELVEQTYQWSKLGYNLEDALGLSKASTVFAKVADTSQEQAMKNLITILKAYGIEAKNVMDVVDKMDNLNNRYAVSAEGLGEGLERSASALAMTGNSLEQSLAMLTGAGEITQNLDNTGNALKVMALRLQNMKGKLEELDEPVDDLMEVSKVQTQILKLTHNQVDIFDKKTGEFRSTYDILKDISKIWDSLNSTNRANLTEILFGKNRANIGLALIQSFQSGTVEKAYKDALDSANTATKEYEKMMEGIEAHTNALKGAVEELSNTMFNKETVNRFIDSGKGLIELLNLIVTYTGKTGIALSVVIGYITATKQLGIRSGLKFIATQLGIIKTEANAASKAALTLKSALKGIATGLAIGAVVSLMTTLADKLITTDKELQEMSQVSHDALVDLKQSVDELENSKGKIDSVSESYAKIATTVSDVTEKKQQLQEMQNDLKTSYSEEAEGIDLLNGKYSEQIKKLDEIKKKQEEEFRTNNIANIAEAQRLSKLYVNDSKFVNQTNYTNGDVNTFTSKGMSKDEKKIFKVGDSISLETKHDWDALKKIVSEVQGVRKGLGNSLYLSGDIKEAKNQLEKVIEKLGNVKLDNSEILKIYEAQYNVLKDDVEIIKSAQPYLDNEEGNNGMVNSLVNNFSNSLTNALSEVSFTPFYNKLDEAQSKLQKLANPDNLSISEYQGLYNEVHILEDELYKLAGNSQNAKKAVEELFEGFKQGVLENGDGLDKFVQRFEDSLEKTFKTTAETVTTVQEAIGKLGEGKGLSHTDAWKLLKDDSEGYLKTIKLVNGEYVFSEKELIAYKDAKIKQSQKDLKQENIRAQNELNNLALSITKEREKLKLLEEEYNLAVKRGKIKTQSDANTYGLQKIKKMRAAIQESEDEAQGYLDVMWRNNLLIEELNQNLGTTRTLSVGIETELNNTVKNFENEIKAIDNTIDSLNDRKNVLESEKKVLEEQLNTLNKQKETIEETLKNYDAVADAVADYVKLQTDSIQKQIDALKEQKKIIEDSYDERIKALKAENDERDLALRKEQALIDLANAESQKKKVWSSDRGIEWGTSTDDIAKARKTIADIEAEERLNALEKEKEEALKGFDEKEKAYESQIKTFEEYAKKYTDVASDIQKAENEMLADQILGSNWREEVIKEATDTLGVQLNAEQKEIVDDYKAIMQEINDYNVDLNKTVFGNIDTNQRQVLEWNDENLSKFANSIESWGETAEDLRDTVSTVFGVWDTFDGVDIAFSPMLQTSNGAVLLDADTVWDYIYGLIDKAGEGWTSEMLFKLDAEGLKVDGVEVKNLIADIGETAEETSRTMHYVGTDGAYALVCREVENVAKTLDVGIEKVLDTNKALVGNSKMLITYTNNYKNFNSQLKNLVNNEIASLNASIEAKDKDINKTQDEIDAYNNYKSTVQDSLNNAKTELENYKNTLESIAPEMKSCIEGVEHEFWDRHWKIKTYFEQMADAAVSAKDKMCGAYWDIGNGAERLAERLANSSTGYGIINSAGDAALLKELKQLGYYADGGVSASTGLAMLHGTKQKSETIFNANDSKKLYDFVHDTPNITASIMEQAVKLSGFNPSNITTNNKSNTSNINVSIGQVMANNPQELTRNLDVHFEAYFKRKLIEGYVK